MAGSRGWSVIATLCLLVLLSACLGGRPRPVPFVEAPPASGAMTTAHRTGHAGAPIVTVSGRVTTRAGSPVPGTTVALQLGVDAGCAGCGPGATGRTAADGRFLLRVPEGRYVLTCTTRDGRSCRAAGPGGGRLAVSAPVADVRLVASRMRHSHPR